MASPLPPSILDTYCLSTSSLGCNALCMVISFLILWSICLSSSLVYFKNSPEYLMRGTAQVFISSEILLKKFFFSFFVVWWCQLPISPSICRCPFLWTFWSLLDLIVRLLTLCVVCHFPLLAWGIFLCQIPFPYLDCIFSQFALGFPILFRFWRKVWCRHLHQVVNLFPAIYWVCIRQCIS